MSDVPLTDEQQQLVEEYHGVIYKVARKFTAPISELYDAGAIALCKSAQAFNGDRDRFVRYAYVAVRNAMTTAQVKFNKQYYADYEFIETISDSNDINYDQMFINEIVEVSKRIMTTKELHMMGKVLAGSSYDMKLHGSKNRALRKIRDYYKGIRHARRIQYTDDMKQKAIEMKSHGYDYEKIQQVTGINECTARRYYESAGKPKHCTSADMARRYKVDRSTILSHAIEPVKVGGTWRIDKIKPIRKKAKNSDKCYTASDIELLRSDYPTWYVAEQLKRTENAVRIARCRLRVE